MTEDCVYKADSQASREWQAISGCPADVPIPVELDGGSGTACSHWDEVCLRGEMMSGWLSGGMELSRMTVGGLEDIGYEVNYAGADEFGVDKLDPTCVKDLCSGRRRRLGEPGKLDFLEEKRSDKGAEIALAFGKAELKELSKKRSKMSPSVRGDDKDSSRNAEDGAVYVADRFVSVIYEDDQGVVRSLAVTN